MRLTLFKFYILLGLASASFLLFHCSSPSTQRAPSGQPKDTDSIKKCCLCIYDNERSESETQRFRDACSTWQIELKKSGECTKATSYALDKWFSSNLPTGCDAIELKYNGHSGEENGDLCRLIGVCTKKNQECTKLNYDSYACSVFKNEQLAEDLAKKIQAELPDSCVASISANMCNGLFNSDTGIETCNSSSRLKFIIDKKCIYKQYTKCNPPGGACNLDADGNSSFSCYIMVKDEHLNTTQKCCLDITKKQSETQKKPGIWTMPGVDCPPLPK